MRFEYVLIEKLPKLAWLALIDKRTKVITVLHGQHVECQEEFFVAGVWDGQFEKADFNQSSVFWGTGAKITNQGVVFVTPSHALERIVLTEDDNSISISNSIPFLLSFNKLELDQKIDQYESLLCSILDGPLKYKEEIPMRNRKNIKQYIVSLITIDSNMKIEIVRRKKTKEFVNFGDYYERLMTSMKSLKRNGESLKRENNCYGLVSTISSGYDSATCAAIAKKIGCNKVVTLSGGKYDKDSGESIATQIGYSKVIKRDFDSYKIKEGCVDAEYVSSGEQASQLQFCVFEDIFADNIVFFGVRGSYWNKASDFTDDYEMCGYFYYETDVSWTENALKNGYIVAPLPTFGADVCSSIKRISNSEEMKPWTLGTTYDKPIPRRILEESGVKRTSFGTHKYGGGFSFCYDTYKSLEKKMTKEGYESFLAFIKETKNERKYFLRLIHKIKFFYLILPLYLKIMGSRIGIKSPFVVNAIKMSNPGAPSDLFFWSVDIMKERYREMLCQD